MAVFAHGWWTEWGGNNSILWLDPNVRSFQTKDNVAFATIFAGSINTFNMWVLAWYIDRQVAWPNFSLKLTNLLYTFFFWMNKFGQMMLFQNEKHTINFAFMATDNAQIKCNKHRREIILVS